MAGGEDRNVCSIWNRSHGTRKLSGKHPLDGETFLSKNKEQRVNGSQGLNGFNGYQRSTGFRVSRDSGFPMVSRAFKGVGISIIQKFQGSRDERFQGFKVQGLEGERAPRFS